MTVVNAPARTRRIGEVAAAIRVCGQVALLILAVILAARALFYFQSTLAMVRWPFEATYGEATMLYESQLLDEHPLDGLRQIYGPQHDDRFLAGNYPPVYLLLWTLKPGPAAYPTGRALSLLGGIVAALAGGVAAYATARGSRRVRAGAALLGGAAFVCTVPVFQQIGIAKPDMVALGCAACGLATFEAVPRRRGTIAAGIWFALALLAKQSIGFALVAAAIAALRRGPRVLLTLLLTVALTLAVVLGGLWIIAGPTLYEHLVLYNLRPWNQDQFERFDSKFLRLHWPIVAPALAYAAWGLFARPRSALTYYPFLALATLIMVGAEGAGRSYYIELCLAAGLGTALAVGALLDSHSAKVLPFGLATLLLLAFYVAQTYTVFIHGQYVPEPPLARGGHLNRILATVDAAPDPILSDSPDFLAMRGRPVIIDDPYLAELMRREGRWDNAGVIAALQDRRYPLVVTSTRTLARTGDTNYDRQLRERWGDAFVDTLYANYQQAGSDGFIPRAP